ncbi:MULTISPECIES: type II secretion system F family protein [unclassified Xanthobacter]|uniref:type II secretion system F family protein n=1 Tax=unclassified Xanthobacter TaxID=2623496 RepID=UPI001F41AC7B|nr:MULTISPECIES: type II secretion system F family protein [unclassified Xanthobacter]
MSTLAGILAAIAAMSAVAALFYADMLAGADVDRRRRAIIAQAPISGEEQRRIWLEQMEERIAEMRKREQDRNRRRPLKEVLEQAGLKWSERRFIYTSIGCGVAVFAGLVVMSINVAAAVLVGAVAGYLVPQKALDTLRARRVREFVADLPEALNLMVRGVRAGLYINDCVRLIVTEMRGPIRDEFQRVADAQQLGATLAEAIEQMSERVQSDETRFLSLAISIQAVEGGGIAEPLENLANTMRERVKLRDKIAAMTQEAKFSVRILALMPLGALALNYAMTPDRTALLWTTTLGQVSMAAGALWMGLGILIMNRMQKI